MFQCCIFDLDGTLIDSLEDLADACNWVLKENGLPTHPVDAYRRFVGDGAYKLVERMLPEPMRDEQIVVQYKALFDKRYNGHYLDKTRPYPGVMDLLAHLKEKGLQLAVLSNKPNQFVQKICREVFGEGFFAAVWGQRDGAAKKPAPDGVFAILKELQAAPEEALLIGDSNVDIQTAKNAGIAGAGVSWGFRGRQELKEAGADFIADDAAQLETYILA